MTTGIHHITAIASDANRTYEFYAHKLGLRLVKKTVNQDDVGTYHLFFGDKLGHPGMDLTFFIFQPPQPGRRGNGLVTTVSLAVPEAALSFWQTRFERLNIKHKVSAERFGFPRIQFYDDDEQQLELVGIPDNQLDPAADVWVTSEVSIEHAIRAFHSATLTVSDIRQVEPILKHALGYEQLDEYRALLLYGLPHQHRAQYLEVHVDPAGITGLNAAGTVHHIAFRVNNATEQEHVRNTVRNLGIYTTEVIDRFYFASVYFRIPAGILFELATDGPGFTADEQPEKLGESLALPPFLEPQRTQIEENLPALTTI